MTRSHFHFAKITRRKIIEDKVIGTYLCSRIHMPDRYTRVGKHRTKSVSRRLFIYLTNKQIRINLHLNLYEVINLEHSEYLGIYLQNSEYLLSLSKLT